MAPAWMKINVCVAILSLEVVCMNSLTIMCYNKVDIFDWPNEIGILNSMYTNQAARLLLVH